PGRHRLGSYGDDFIYDSYGKKLYHWHRQQGDNDEYPYQSYSVFYQSDTADDHVQRVSGESANYWYEIIYGKPGGIYQYAVSRLGHDALEGCDPCKYGYYQTCQEYSPFSQKT